MSSRSSRTIYVGNLPGDICMREVKDLFLKYGPIVDIDLKIPPRPPCYAFVEYEDPRDADDAIYGRDGYNFDGFHLRVKLAHGGRHSSSHRSSSYNRSSNSRELVEKENVLIGDFMPSVKFTGDLRTCAYLDVSKPQHSQIKKFCHGHLEKKPQNMGAGAHCQT
ncbi:hypothetical protein EV1_019180 [Malus domestica]